MDRMKPLLEQGFYDDMEIKNINLKTLFLKFYFKIPYNEPFLSNNAF
ncbi:hypothetical protein HpHA192_01740 [Helicobacter pylori]